MLYRLNNPLVRANVITVDNYYTAGVEICGLLQDDLVLSLLSNYATGTAYQQDVYGHHTIAGTYMTQTSTAGTGDAYYHSSNSVYLCKQTTVDLKVNFTLVQRLSAFTIRTNYLINCIYGHSEEVTHMDEVTYVMFDRWIYGTFYLATLYSDTARMSVVDKSDRYDDRVMSDQEEREVEKIVIYISENTNALGFKAFNVRDLPIIRGFVWLAYYLSQNAGVPLPHDHVNLVTKFLDSVYESYGLQNKMSIPMEENDRQSLGVHSVQFNPIDHVPIAPNDTSEKKIVTVVNGYSKEVRVSAISRRQPALHV